MRRSKAYENLGEKRKSFEDIFYFCEAQLADGQSDNSEALRRQKNILMSLAEDEAKKHMKARELLVPQRHQMQEYFRMFNYDVFTIPTTSH